MPNINTFLPLHPLHWTSIMHYLILLGSLFLLMASGDKAPNVYIFAVATLAVLTGLDLYVNYFPIVPLFVFLARVLILGIPLAIGGLGPTEHTRAGGLVIGFVAALPLLVITFFACNLGILSDPRIILVIGCGE